MSGRWSNAPHTRDRWREEEAVFADLFRSVAERPVIGAGRATRYDPGAPLILSHFAFARHGTVRRGSDWTSAAVLDPADFGYIAGVSGAGRGWRAVILVSADIDVTDETVRRVASRAAPAEEFDFPYDIDERHVAWLPTGW